MRYLLDSNMVIALMAGRPPSIRERLAALDPGDAAISSSVMHELFFGACNSARVEANIERLSRLALPELEFDFEDARVAGRIRAELRRAGTSIGPYGLLIAGQALARGLTVVTANMREFERVVGLRVENWAAV